jgi:uncharacterized membrane protein YtjA (UPF0391 family)
MLYWTAIFLVIAVVSGLLGFVGLSSGAASIARVLAVIFVVAFAVSLLTPLLSRG